MYDPTTVQVQWSVKWAACRTSRDLVLAGARRCALETYGKKNASSAFRLGLIYILFFNKYHDVNVLILE